jgi:hypothetical protein
MPVEKLPGALAGVGPQASHHDDPVHGFKRSDALSEPSVTLP